MLGACGMQGRGEKKCRLLVVKAEGNSLDYLSRNRNNIRIDVK